MAKLCNVDSCNNKHKAKGFCNKHYMQMRRYGMILKRTIKDDNEIIIKETYAEIVMYNIKHEEVATTKVSLEDLEIVSKYKWRLSSHGYARATDSDYKFIHLHRLILGLQDRSILVDHINRDRLDNRRENLRLCNGSQNNMNSSVRSDNKSGVTGVSWSKPRKKWEVGICVNKKRIKLGRYKDKEEAIQVRKEAEKKYFGEFAPSNKS